MKMVCGWCSKELGEKFPEQPGITHGICRPCRDKLEKQIQVDRETALQQESRWTIEEAVRRDEEMLKGEPK